MYVAPYLPVRVALPSSSTDPVPEPHTNPPRPATHRLLRLSGRPDAASRTAVQPLLVLLHRKPSPPSPYVSLGTQLFCEPCVWSSASLATAEGRGRPPCLAAMQGREVPY